MPETARGDASPGLARQSTPDLALAGGRGSAVEGDLADPVEAPAHQQELRWVELAQLDSDRVLEQGPLQDEVVVVGDGVGERALPGVLGLEGGERDAGLRRDVLRPVAVQGV